MSKINRVRFVNFTYNDNRHIYDETFDFYGGENTLLNLQNGGGKTVLVQMMMQPILPKQRLKDRLFKSYFTKSTAPTYIMIEWKLDHNAGYVMTGIGVHKISGKSLDDDTGDNLKVITFISEYARHNPYDIESINLTYKENGLTKLHRFDKVITNLSNAEKSINSKVKVFRWDQREDKKRYAEELTTFKIYQAEWKNLMLKINETEAGLTTFFNDCKTSKALIKNWFLPTIEEQLNKNGKVVNNIRELIKNHAEQLVKNEKIIKEKDIFERFNVEHNHVIDSLDNYQKVVTDIEEAEASIGNLYLYINDLIKKLSSEKRKGEEQIIRLDEKIQEVLYDKLSFEYNQMDSELRKIEEKIRHYEEDVQKVEDKLKELNKREKIFLCAELNEKLQKILGEIRENEIKIKKLELDEKEINKQVSDISYSLKIKYQEKNKKDQNEKITLENLSESKQREAENTKKCIDEKKYLIDKLKDERSQLQSIIGIFENKEKDMKIKKKI